MSYGLNEQGFKQILITHTVHNLTIITSTYNFA